MTAPVGMPASAGASVLPVAGKSELAARQTAEQFEAMFLSQFLGQMFEGIRTDGPFGGGAGESVFRDLLNQEYAKTVARAGGVGIADQVYREILKAQEGAQA